MRSNTVDVLDLTLFSHYIFLYFFIYFYLSFPHFFPSFYFLLLFFSSFFSLSFLFFPFLPLRSCVGHLILQAHWLWCETTNWLPTKCQEINQFILNKIKLNQINWNGVALVLDTITVAYISRSSSAYVLLQVWVATVWVAAVWVATLLFVSVRDEFWIFLC